MISFQNKQTLIVYLLKKVLNVSEKGSEVEEKDTKSIRSEKFVPCQSLEAINSLFIGPINMLIINGDASMVIFIAIAMPDIGRHETRNVFQFEL